MRTIPKVAIIIGLAAVVGFGFGLARTMFAERTPGATGSNFREGFLSQGQTSCVSSAKLSTAKQGLTIPDEKISAYCQCAMGQLNDHFSNEQLFTIAQAATNKVPVPLELSGQMSIFMKDCAQKIL